MADIVTPALGESVSEATVARWTKKPGEAVKKDELLVELETDKVNLEVVAPADGVLSQVLAEEGASVTAGAKLGVVTEGGAATAAPTKKGGTTVSPAPEGDAQPESAGAPKSDAAPAASRQNTPSSPAIPDTSAPDQRGGGAALEIKTPAMGESVSEGTVGAWA